MTSVDDRDHDHDHDDHYVGGIITMSNGRRRSNKNGSSSSSSSTLFLIVLRMIVMICSLWIYMYVLLCGTSKGKEWYTRLTDRFFDDNDDNDASSSDSIKSAMPILHIAIPIMISCCLSVLLLVTKNKPETTIQPNPNIMIRMKENQHQLVQPTTTSSRRRRRSSARMTYMLGAAGWAMMTKVTTLISSIVMDWFFRPVSNIMFSQRLFSKKVITFIMIVFIPWLVYTTSSLHRHLIQDQDQDHHDDNDVDNRMMDAANVFGFAALLILSSIQLIPVTKHSPMIIALLSGGRGNNNNNNFNKSSSYDPMKLIPILHIWSGRIIAISIIIHGILHSIRWTTMMSSNDDDSSDSDRSESSSKSNMPSYWWSSWVLNGIPTRECWRTTIISSYTEEDQQQDHDHDHDDDEDQDHDEHRYLHDHEEEEEEEGETTIGLVPECNETIQNFMGIIGGIIVLLILITSSNIFRRYCYDTFYKLHILILVPMLYICIIVHWHRSSLYLLGGFIYYIIANVPMAIETLLSRLVTTKQQQKQHDDDDYVASSSCFGSGASCSNPVKILSVHKISDNDNTNAENAIANTAIHNNPSSSSLSRTSRTCIGMNIAVSETAYSSYQCGQYIKLYCPQIDSISTHPFTMNRCIINNNNADNNDKNNNVDNNNNVVDYDNNNINNKQHNDDEGSSRQEEKYHQMRIIFRVSGRFTSQLAQRVIMSSSSSSFTHNTTHNSNEAETEAGAETGAETGTETGAETGTTISHSSYRQQRQRHDPVDIYMDGFYGCGLRSLLSLSSTHHHNVYYDDDGGDLHHSCNIKHIQQQQQEQGHDVIMFIAGGIGITPYLSLLDEIICCCATTTTTTPTPSAAGGGGSAVSSISKEEDGIMRRSHHAPADHDYDHNNDHTNDSSENSDTSMIIKTSSYPQLPPPSSKKNLKHVIVHWICRDRALIEYIKREYIHPMQKKGQQQHIQQEQQQNGSSLTDVPSLIGETTAQSKIRIIIHFTGKDINQQHPHPADAEQSNNNNNNSNQHQLANNNNIHYYYNNNHHGKAFTQSNFATGTNTYYVSNLPHFFFAVTVSILGTITVWLCHTNFVEKSQEHDDDDDEGIIFVRLWGPFLLIVIAIVSAIIMNTITSLFITVTRRLLYRRQQHQHNNNNRYPNQNHRPSASMLTATNTRTTNTTTKTTNNNNNTSYYGGVDNNNNHIMSSSSFEQQLENHHNQNEQQQSTTSTTTTSNATTIKYPVKVTLEERIGRPDLYKLFEEDYSSSSIAVPPTTTTTDTAAVITSNGNNNKNNCDDEHATSTATTSIDAGSQHALVDKSDGCYCSITSSVRPAIFACGPSSLMKDIRHCVSNANIARRSRRRRTMCWWWNKKNGSNNKSNNNNSGDDDDDDGYDVNEKQNHHHHHYHHHNQRQQQHMITLYEENFEL